MSSQRRPPFADGSGKSQAWRSQRVGGGGRDGGSCCHQRAPQGADLPTTSNHRDAGTRNASPHALGHLGLSELLWALYYYSCHYRHCYLAVLTPACSSTGSPTLTVGLKSLKAEPRDWKVVKLPQHPRPAQVGTTGWLSCTQTSEVTNLVTLSPRTITSFLPRLGLWPVGLPVSGIRVTQELSAPVVPAFPNPSQAMKGLKAF